MLIIAKQKAIHLIRLDYLQSKDLNWVDLDFIFVIIINLNSYFTNVIDLLIRVD